MESVDINEDLYKQLERRAKKYDFDSTDTYAEEILATVMMELDQGNQDDNVTDRLEDLGYL